MPRRRAGIQRDIAAALGRFADRLPAIIIDTLREQPARLNQLDQLVQDIEQRLRQWHGQEEASRGLAEIRANRHGGSSDDGRRQGVQVRPRVRRFERWCRCAQLDESRRQ